MKINRLLIVGILLLIPLIGFSVSATGNISWVVNISAKNNTYQDYTWDTLGIIAPTIVIKNPSLVEVLNTTVGTSGSNTIWINQRGTWTAYLYDDLMSLVDSNTSTAMTEQYTFTATWDNDTGIAGDGQEIHYVDTTSYGDICYVFVYNPSGTSNSAVVPCMASGAASYTPGTAGIWNTTFGAWYDDLAITIEGAKDDIVITNAPTLSCQNQTFGNTEVGPYIDGTGSRNYQGYLFTTPPNMGTVNSISYYGSMEPPDTSSRAIIWDASYNVVALGSINYPPTSPNFGWVESDFTSVSLSPNTDYYLIEMNNHGSGGYWYTYNSGISGHGVWGTANWGTGVPSVVLFDSESVSLYVNYTATSCEPFAEFTSNTTSGTAPLPIQFNDTSFGYPTSWLWDFGGIDTSTDQNPIYTFLTPGTYYVNLTVSNSYGTHFNNQTDYITATVPTVSFTSNTTTGAAPLSVEFYDTSTGTFNSWLWDFGGDGASTDQNPVHTFNLPGTYYVNLTVCDINGCYFDNETNYIAATVPLASFGSNVTSGLVPLPIEFYDGSEGTPASWLWNFGDGSGSTDQYPVYTYTTPGIYYVNLTVCNINGCYFDNETAYITAVEPFASFTTTITSGSIVQFNDTSTGSPITWTWDFGDGIGMSWDQNPFYIYPTPGTYTVYLTVVDSYGIYDYITKDITVTSLIPPPNAIIYINPSGTLEYDNSGVTIYRAAHNITLNNEGVFSFSMFFNKTGYPPDLRATIRYPDDTIIATSVNVYPYNMISDSGFTEATFYFQPVSITGNVYLTIDLSGEDVSNYYNLSYDAIPPNTVPGLVWPYNTGLPTSIGEYGFTGTIVTENMALPTPTTDINTWTTGKISDIGSLIYMAVLLSMASVILYIIWMFIQSRE